MMAFEGLEVLSLSFRFLLDAHYPPQAGRRRGTSLKAGRELSQQTREMRLLFCLEGKQAK